jgi:hypothetical protein
MLTNNRRSDTVEESEFDVVFKESDIEKHLYIELMKRGYVPSDEELEDIAQIMFDYFVDLTDAFVEDDTEEDI